MGRILLKYVEARGGVVHGADMDDQNPPPASKDVIDLRPLKEGARRLYPPGHSVREALANEPDFILRTDAIAKLPLLLRLTLACKRNT